MSFWLYSGRPQTARTMPRPASFRPPTASIMRCPWPPTRRSWPAIPGHFVRVQPAGRRQCRWLGVVQPVSARRLFTVVNSRRFAWGRPPIPENFSGIAFPPLLPLAAVRPSFGPRPAIDPGHFVRLGLRPAALSRRSPGLRWRRQPTIAEMAAWAVSDVSRAWHQIWANRYSAAPRAS